ncbi:hypothetical protein [Kribbella sp. CA-293567]|uniref:hypothetical protein n=1 Tax=Kribbella sp. CA-293567 TaxID=3002436 RepID=UPI0022DE13E6|nr:hypothetical protein [Kribbella sp. CA-293567]WBQ06611.1 hypothetical protein OX958_07395 [Kribbella sp. CA-293567]
MNEKPQLGLGIVVGVVAGWLATVVVSYAGVSLLRRVATFNGDLIRSLPWVVLILAAGAALALVLSIRTIAGGALLGAGLLMTFVGLAVQVLPIRHAFEFAKIFQLPGTRYQGYSEWDGSTMFVGVLLLVLGITRLRDDSRRRPTRLQDSPPSSWQNYPPR